MTIHLGPPLPTASSGQPGSMGGSPLALPYLALLLVGFTWHPASPSDPVSSYLTLSPLPAEAGGLLSVALSLGLPPLDVIQHHPLWSPDFPPPELSGGGHLDYSDQTNRKRPFSAISASSGGLACAAYLKYASAQSLAFLDLAKNCALPKLRAAEFYFSPCS